MLLVHTIGHSNHPIERFIELLRRQRITRLVDVRSHPASRWAPQFGKRPLERALGRAGIDYRFLGDALGGRPADPAFYDADGRVDYARRAQAEDFLDGVERLMTLAAEAPTAILCAEEDPARCHRRRLITPALRARGAEVVHIRGDGRVQPEADDAELDGQLGLF
ncbi:MAG TPA: DUF488 domain-containing protein [Pseudomonadales bacterium]